MIKRATVNFVVDLVSFVSLLGLAFTGAIMKYILPPGTGGRGRVLHEGRGQYVKQLWSMTRHEWGDIHFYIAVLFIALMALHLMLHWAWIKNYLKSLFSRKAR